MARSPRQQALYGKPAAPAPAHGPPALSRPRAEVAAQLQERIKLAKEIQESFSPAAASLVDPLFPRRVASTYMRDAIKWSEFNSTLLKTAFTNNEITSEYDAAAFGMFLNSGTKGTLELFAEGVEQQIQKLESILERLHLYAEPPAFVIEARAPMPIEYRQQKVFIVHGHDDTPKAEVARFIERLGFEAIILHERPNKGRALITKFREEAADVGFAVD
jgi:vacuolar-type H+-ATPase subunit I/STV1